MTKKSLLLMLSLVLALTIGLGSTLAYLTDRDSEANVFTMGNVDIELKEDFEQGSTLIPGQEIEKKPTITNTGDTDAWVWLTFSIPTALDNPVQGTEQGSNENIIHWNPKGATTEGYVTDARVNAALEAGFFDGYIPEGVELSADYINENKMHWNVFNSIAEGENMYQEEINGVPYNTYVLVYNKALEPGETTLPNIEKVYMDAQIDIDPKGDLYRVVNGEVTPVDWNINEDGAPIIYASAYAVQKEGFETPQAAYAAYNAQWGDKGSANYAVEGPSTVTTPDAVEEVEDSYYLIDRPLYNITDATEPYTINGNGNKVTMIASEEQTFDWRDNYTIPLMGNVFSSANGAKVTVNDLTLTGTMQSVMAGNYETTDQGKHNTEFNNVNIVNAKVVSLSANTSPALSVYGKLDMNNCKVYGTTLSPLDTDPMWPVYDVAMVNESNTTAKNSEIGTIIFWAKAKLTLIDSEVDTIVLVGNQNTNTKYGIVVGAGSTVNAIDLSKVTNPDKLNITVQDGGKINSFIDDGVSYKTIEEWKAAQ